MQTKRDSRGQGMTEYILIVALVAIATIGVVGLFGNDLRHLFGMSSDALSGKGNVSMRAGKSTSEMETKHLVNFAENNSGTAGSATPNAPSTPN